MKNSIDDGTTEVAWATVATPADLRAAPGTVGRPPPRTTVRVLDGDGRELPPGERGRVFVANALVFEGYTDASGGQVVDGLVGVDDEEFGQRLRAFVVRRAGSTLDDSAVKALVRQRLARYKVPRDVVFVDALPRNAAGKVLKRELT